MVGPALFWRAPLTALLLVSWTLATSHCALAAAAANAIAPAIEKAADECPMHAAAKQAPQPEKKNRCADLPCCKNLFASVPAMAKALSKPMCCDIANDDLVVRVVLLEKGVSRKLLPIVGTGPPGANNFTESVLQQSILAHAPPLSLI
jgi:hypothetical protein